jgi:glycosyltransferase 2 family protein
VTSLRAHAAQRGAVAHFADQRLDYVKRMGTTRVAKVAATIALTALCVAYVLWKIDVGRTAHLLEHADLTYFIIAAAIWIAAVWPMAWRWQRLLAAQEVVEGIGWLSRAYFVSYAAAQVLPTSIGGDASRIFEGTRRHPGKGRAVAGSVLVERAIGGAATLTLAAIGFVLAVGRYNVGAYLWLELAFILLTAAGAFALFSRTMRRPLASLVPALRWARLERPLRIAYEGVHAYRHLPRTVGSAFLLTFVIQTFRVAAIWLVGKSVGVQLSPRPYYVMGPMLLLVMLVPFTVNGAALREAFFVNFLGKLHVSADAAFATGFLVFVLSLMQGLPGAFIVAWEAIAKARSRESPRSGGG